MDRLELSVSRFRRSLWRMLWLRLTVRSLVVGLWIAGCVILSLRLLWHLPISQVAWTLAPLVLLTFAAAWLARRRIPPAWAARAVIDRSNQTHGLVMADGEIDLGVWKDKAIKQTMENPRIHWMYPRAIGGMFAASIFVLLTLAMPESWLTHQKLFARELDVATDVKHLEEKLDVLEELEIVPEENADAFRRQLKKVKEDAEGTDPAKTLEAMAYLEDQFKKLAEDAADNAAERAREAAALAATAQALDKAASKMSEESLRKSMENLAELAKKADDNAQANGSDAMENAGNISKDGLSADELKELAEALGNSSQAMQELLAKLGEAGMIDPTEFGEGFGPLSLEEIELLAEGFGAGEGMEFGDLEELLEAYQLYLDGEPGDMFLGYFPCRGRINRGPGPAQLNYLGETEEHGVTFENKVIMPGGIKPNAKMMVKAIRKGRPGGNEVKELSTGGGLGAGAGTGGAHTRVVLPTHRRIVQEYFNREK